MSDEQQAIRDTKNALSALLLAASFVAEAGTWPGFKAYVERETGRDLGCSREGMATAIQIADHLRTELAGACDA